VNPGNSGGPLFDLHGRVVGVVDLKLIFSEGLNFAIPVNRLKRFLQDREAYAFDKDNPNTGYRYLPPPPKGEPKANQ
jgi:serine protease Do